MRTGTCIHHNGDWRNKTCEAGVCYRDVTPKPDAPGSAFRKPCNRLMFWDNPSPEQKQAFAEKGTCDKYLEPTTDQIAEYEAGVEAAIRNLETSLPLIAQVKKEHKGTDWRGVKECPICKAVLHMTHAKYNGHTSGKCETKGCLSWIE